VSANQQPLVQLKANPYQIAALAALAARHCPKCSHQWAVQWSVVASLSCPHCGTRGKRDYTRIGLVAGRQGGKTRFGTLAVVLECSFPDAYWWVTAPTYRDLTDFVEPAFFAQIPQQWVDEGDWSASDRILTLKNRTVIAFRSLENPQAMRGPTLDGVLTDEACKVAQMVYPVGNATLAIKEGVWIFTTTPMGEDWVYDEIMQPAERGEPGFWVARYKSIENPIMSADFIEQQRLQMSDEMFRQEYEADIVTFQGAIYGPLVNPCVVDDAGARKLLPEWPNMDSARPSIVGLDPGSDHPFAGVLAVSTPDALIVCGEYSEREKPAMVHAQGLKLMALGLSPTWAIDRSQAQMQIELAQHGLFASPAENDVVAGIERVKSWMKSGRLKIVKSRCPRLCKELASYRWKETTANDGSSGRQEPYKRKDDLCDALRYLVMRWPHLPQPVELPTTRDLSQMPDKMRRDIERLQRRMKADDEKVKDGTGDFYSEYESEFEPVGENENEFSGFYA